MEMPKKNPKLLYRSIHDYVILTVAMVIGVIGLNLFLLPNEITMGGIVGIASVIYWGTGIPVQTTYFVFNAILLLFALKTLGWKFCAKTIYAVVVFTVGTSVMQRMMDPNLHLLADQKFMACIVGGVFMGTSVGLGLSTGGSSGGSDVVAAIIHKYRDVSLGHIILFCDIAIVTSSYLVLRDWEKVLYSYVLMFIISFCVDYVVNTLRQSVQFFIISDRYQEIGEAINKIANRGCTTLNGNGFYSRKDIKVVFCIAKKSESSFIFDLINEIDPDAFVAQSAVIGVYGQGFDRVKVKKKMRLEEINEKLGKGDRYEK
jgi:uncharacterized membrane-anchored protein YitT (DUF2179 family)